MHRIAALPSDSRSLLENGSPPVDLPPLPSSGREAAKRAAMGRKRTHSSEEACACKPPDGQVFLRAGEEDDIENWIRS
ncbi:hypothetical protein EJB05_01767, partial [Eragrostis curvula]